jgi:hypothetical protein
MLGLREALQPPRTPTGRPAYVTRHRRAMMGERGARCGRRFVRLMSIVSSLDWRLSPGARGAVPILLSLERAKGDESLSVPTCAASLATSLGVTDDTVRTYLTALEREDYCVRLPTGRRGGFRIRFLRKMTRYVQHNEADLHHIAQKRALQNQRDAEVSPEISRPINVPDSYPSESLCTGGENSVDNPPSGDEEAQEGGQAVEARPIRRRQGVLEEAIANSYRLIQRAEQERKHQRVALDRETERIRRGWMN